MIAAAAVYFSSAKSGIHAPGLEGAAVECTCGQIGVCEVHRIRFFSSEEALRILLDAFQATPRELGRYIAQRQAAELPAGIPGCQELAAERMAARVRLHFHPEETRSRIRARRRR